MIDSLTLSSPTQEVLSLVRGSAVGRFLVLGALGAGGMGVVFAAYDPALDRKVALKLLHGGDRARLVAEAQTMARLRHPNVVAVHEIGGIEGEGAPFVVMEHVEGGTLRSWLEAAARSWPEVLAMFLGAGEGLAAAHRESIVHRDFKPDNVLVDRDGRPRVADFGLAGVASARAGTPAYMAPEQQRGEPCDARADQYAFCVALRQALPAARTPDWLRKVVARGLAADREARWPTLDALLAELRRDRRRRRRALAGAAAAVAIVAAFAVGRRQADAASCDAGAGLAAEVWNDAARARVRAAFLATGRPFARGSFERVDAALSTRLAAWAETHRDTCAATHVRHEQSDELLDLRMACLARARGDAATLVTLLASADGESVERAIDAVVRVADTAHCADAAVLRAAVPPPRDAGAARELWAIRLELGRVLALHRLGRVQDGLAAARALVPRARALGHAPALAEAYDAASAVESDGGDVEAAISLSHAAVRAAEEAHDDATRAAALNRLILLVGYRRHGYVEGAALARLAEGAVARAGGSPRLLGALYHGEGLMLASKGETPAALARHIIAFGLAVRDGGWPSAPVAKALSALGADLELLGDYRAARAMLARASAVAEAVFGPDHPAVLPPLLQGAQQALALSDAEAAASEFERALRLCEDAYGPDHEKVGFAVHGLARARLMEGRLEEARASAERAARIFAGNEVRLMSTLEVLGDIASKEGRLDDALALARRKLDMRARIDGPEHARTALSEGSLADRLRALGRLPEARAAAERSLAVITRARGPSHAVTGGAMLRLAGIMTEQGEARPAVALCERGLPLVENGFGKESIPAVESLAVCSDALLAAGDRGRARALAEWADTVAATHHYGAELEAGARFRHARALPAADRPRACAMAEESRTALASLPYAEDLRAVDDFLDGARCTSRLHNSLTRLARIDR